ncbi:MAG TPA: ATP-binding protein [Hanamia sp.]
MKKNLFILLVLLPLTIFAQDNEVFKIDSLPKQGILLDKDWKFMLGDKPEYANVDFDDADWKSINPTLDIFKLPQIPKTGEIVWLRLHLSIDNPLNRQLVMLVIQSGASEIYLNGKLLQLYGNLSNKPSEIKAYNPLFEPVPFPIQKSGSQFLAVRYALQPHIFYTAITGSPTNGLYIRINSTENGVKTLLQKVNVIEEYVVIVSTSFLLFIIFLALYISYPAKKVNLYFSIYLLGLTIWSSIFFYAYTHHYIESWYWLYNIFVIESVICSLFLLFAVYKLFVHKTGLFFWAVAGVGIISIPMAALVYGWGWLVLGKGFYLIMNLDIIRVTIIAVKRKKRGAWIIATGSFIYVIFWAMFLYSVSNLNVDQVFQINYFFIIASYAIPLSVAIFLGYDFALTTRNLQFKLVEVENLSAEKQQILSNQNEMLEKQVKERTSALNESLENLKSTQKQLIQSEKMASLGELTAGIAHEIQNPLNFVNNFSEVNKELIAEMKQEINKGNFEEVKVIADDIDENSEKINHHGKRAGDIVKGMLQHSRSSTGVKEPTDINALADEYLRLSYHGLRAKDKGFNAEMKTDFDTSIGKINIIPQDIGRVLLNLFNNAFYAVNERQNAVNEQISHNLISYEPVVSVTTKKSGNSVIITVSDNGGGIPQNIVDKIFQPFFTTKPTGEGTGLGLSLSYDIIKAHGGELKVNSEENKFTEFIIQLSI